MDFELVGQIRDIQPIAVGRAIREQARLRKRYSKEENSTASFLMRTRNCTGIYASLTKVARTMDIRRTVSFVSQCPDLWSELSFGPRPKILLPNQRLEAAAQSAAQPSR